MSIDVAVKSHNLAKISRKEAENTVFRVKVHNSLSYLRIFFIGKE
jgi:ribosomal protein L25 (general stress protein Ctc)